MKKYIIPFFIISFFTINSCNKNIVGRTDNIAALNPTNVDINGGNWKTILLSRNDSFAVATPAATSSAAYIAEINEIKGAQQNLTSAQKNIIAYWSAGSVLRWNEILRVLVAKHNYPPLQNSDSTYPSPNSANPFNYPFFPFSNPPYSARAYAYISAAQYDALVSAWHYKTLYNRVAPYVADSSITALIPKSGLPSYPSEDAVVGGVTAEMMKLLFPTEIDYIQQKLIEEENYRIWSGANVRSDIVAGEALGRQVAQLFTTRAKADKAGAAAGTATTWSNLVSTTIAAGRTPWVSLELPARPPMLPVFGSVTPFLFSSATTNLLLPPPPPAANSDSMKQALIEEYDLIKNPSRENLRIVQFWADGVGTYTPPGHWNEIAATDFISKNFSEIRWARNMALLNMGLMDAGIVCWNTKYFYFNPRPTQLNSDIKTLTGIPNFPSYISGHSTFSGAASTILGHIIPEKATVYSAMAQEASISRVYGGIHTRFDCSVGLKVGASVGNFAIQRAMIDGAE